MKWLAVPDGQPLAPRRVAIFVDYQNVYRSARDVFFPNSTSHIDGQINPQRLGLKLKGVGNESRVLTEVRVYRGLPSSAKDPKGYGAATRQIALWQQQKLVTVIHRPLNYRTQPPREKGIDVSIAVDFVMMAQRGEYDIGVLFSRDTDLLPALEAVTELLGPNSCEVAAWADDDGRPRSRLRLRSAGPARHLLDRKCYYHVQDETDYTVRRRRR